MEYSHKFIITENMMDMFGEVSGDLNPIHIDKQYAINKGFEGKVVYGGLIVAQISKMIGMDLPGSNSLWNHLKIDFIKPLMVDSIAIIEAFVAHESAATSSVIISFKVISNNETIARGTVGVSLI